MEEEYTFEGLKIALRERNVSESIRLLKSLYQKNPESFRKGLLLSGCLPEPISRTFEKEYTTINFFDNISEFVSIILGLDSEKVAKDFRTLTSDILLAIDGIYMNLKSNEERLLQNEFLEYPFAKQVQMWCTFLENQLRYAEIETIKMIKKQRFITGLEQEIATKSNMSVHDVLEAGYEIFDTLIRFLHFNAGKRIEGPDFRIHTDVSPYMIPSVEEIQYLALNRSSFSFVWEQIKYRNWGISGVENDGIITLYCHSPNVNNLKKERAAIFRYQSYISSLKNRYSYIYSEIFGKTNELFGHFDFTIDNPKSLFEMDKGSFLEVANLFGIYHDIAIESIREVLGDRFDTIRIGPAHNIIFSELLHVVVYLQAIGYIYQKQSFEHVDDNNLNTYKYLAPVFEIKDIVEHFSRMYDYETKYAHELIELFIFRPRPSLDIFAQPLIYLGHQCVVFTPALMEQMNSTRILEQHLSKWGVDVSSKGSVFEQNVRDALEAAPNVEVCSKPVVFKAFDGKDVEYDIVATFDNKIMLVELKCINRPYSPKEFKMREDDILKGVAQVNRRAEVLKKQWELFKGKVDISLPADPPEDSEILKIVCLNIFDFSGRVEDSVYITDVSSLCKFLTSPEVYRFEYGKGEINAKLYEVIWKDKPTSKDLIRFLKAPVAMRKYYENLVESPRPIIRIKEDDIHFAIQDFTISSNPYLLSEDISTRKSKKRAKPKSKRKKRIEKRSRKMNRKS